MECNSCKNKEICHMYFRINKYSKYANISIINCKFYNIINSNTNSNTNSNINNITFKEDVLKCDLCGKQICSCCATFNNAQQILCRDCWANY